jgi:hypothetical protein
MKSDSHTSEKQTPQSVKQDDKRPPDKVRDAAWSFIEKIRQDDPTLVPAVESCDDHKRDGRSNTMSSEEAGNQRPNNVVVAEATRNFTKKLRESGYELPVVTNTEMGSGSSKVKNLNAAPQSSSTAAKRVHDATKIYIEELKESGYEPPNVTLVEKSSGSSGKHNNHVVERAGGPTLDDIHAAARTFIRGVKQSDPKQHDTAEVTLAEKGSKASEHVGVSERSMERHKAMTPSSTLPPRDSPLTKVFLGQYVSSLIMETITYLKLPYGDLAQEMSIPEMVLRDAIEGRMGLTRGQWVMLGQILSLPTAYELRPAERDGAPCWEICFPPVHVPMDKGQGS